MQISHLCRLLSEHHDKQLLNAFIGLTVIAGKLLETAYIGWEAVSAGAAGAERALDSAQLVTLSPVSAPALENAFGNAAAAGIGKKWSHLGEQQSSASLLHGALHCNTVCVVHAPRTTYAGHNSSSKSDALQQGLSQKLPKNQAGYCVPATACCQLEVAKDPKG
jgi:hypothetical protein